MRTRSEFEANLAKFVHDSSAGVAVTVALLLPVFLGVAALVIDLGKVYVAERELRASTDASALAGAQDIYPGGAVNSAWEYSASENRKNFNDRFGDVKMWDGYPVLSCSTTGAAEGIPCLGADNANTIKVKQSVDVPLYFGPIFGVDTITVSAESTAMAQGGERVPLNIAIVVDTTPSMNGPDAGCGLGSGSTRLDCAKQGIITLLNQLDPNFDKVTLVGFPGIRESTRRRQSNCREDVREAGQSNPDILPYNAGNLTHIYVDLTDDFRRKNSPLIKAASTNRAGAQGDKRNCVGMEAKGDGFNAYTYYASAMLAAQEELKKGNPLAQNAIILLSDADSNAPGSILPVSPFYQCQRAVSYARDYVEEEDAWIFAIGYGAENQDPGFFSGPCPYDFFRYSELDPRVERRSPCGIMENIASDPSRFFSTTGCPGSQSTTDLTEIFEQVAAALQDARLMPNNTS